eukprot:3010657-Lingulodinium_polyedra.AAC.1
MPIRCRRSALQEDGLVPMQHGFAPVNAVLKTVWRRLSETGLWSRGQALCHAAVARSLVPRRIPDLAACSKRAT